MMTATPKPAPDALTPLEAERRRIIAVLAEQTNRRGHADDVFYALEPVLAPFLYSEWAYARSDPDRYAREGWPETAPTAPVWDARARRNRNAMPPNGDWHWCEACGRWEGD